MTLSQPRSFMHNGWVPPALPLALAALTILAALPSVAGAQTFSRRVATGFSRAVFATAPPGDFNRMFVAEQHTGIIKIVNLATGVVSPTPLIDLNGLATGNEQGLLGLAFDPNFAANGYFYVNVTTSADGGDTHIRRYQVDGPPMTATTAQLNSEFEILSFNQPQSNHNGGWIDFSPRDGFLYIASGDGGNFDDTGPGHTAGIGNSQDLTNNLLGKMLRIDVHGDDFPADSSKNYAVPASNPFVGKVGDDEIWSYGLRNPYRGSFDRVTGDMWLGDVGQGAREEIDFQPATSVGGENYGWRLREGTIATPSVGGARPPDNVEPIYDYDRDDDDFGGSVVIGGYVYRGAVPAFQGHYLFSDLGSENIWKLDPQAVDPRASVLRVNDRLAANVGSVNGFWSFSEDAAGNLYMVQPSQGLFRIETNSLTATWQGDNGSAGVAGDGVAWGDPSNWRRGAANDVAFAPEDEAVFAAGSSASTIQLQSDRTASAVTFQAPYTLAGATLRVLSGNIRVDEGVVATVASTLAAENAHHSLRKLGGGTLLVQGTAGQTTVLEGALGGTGTLAFLKARAGGTVAPGTTEGPSRVGQLVVENRLTLEQGATLALDISAGGQIDRLNVGGLATLDGTLRVQFLEDNGVSYQPTAGEVFSFLTAQGGTTGDFDALVLPSLGAHLEWAVTRSADSLALVVNSDFQADFDNNGLVDGADLSVWEASLGITAEANRSMGDADGDRDVDGDDFLVWQRQAGSVAGGTPAHSAPEPQSLALAFSCIVALGRARRRRREE